MLNITNEHDFDDHKGYEGLVAIKFHAAWCSPCIKLEPSWLKMAEEFESSFKFYKVNTDDSKEFTKKFNIKSLPTILLLKDGVEIKRIVGLVLVEPLRKAFKDGVEL